MTQTTGTTTSGPAVVFAAVVKTFGRAERTVRAVDGFDLAVGRGETVALLGRNGAGKSTTIGLLLGLDDPDSGTVQLLGRSPDRAVRAGLVGAMLQDGRPIPRVTVRELITFVASTYPHPMPVAEALALSGVAEYADRRIDNGRRHSGATRCVFVVESTSERVRLTVTDDGRGPGEERGTGPAGGTGLKGLTERLAAAGGSLESGPGAQGGFTVAAELPVDTPSTPHGDPCAAPSR